MRITKTACAILPLATLLSGAIHAAAITEEVVVTASRVERPLSTIPNTVTVIDRKALNQQLAIHNDISTVLGNLIPSYSPSRQKMTNAGESLRGRTPLYMIDGVPQSNPLRNGGREGHTIDPAIIERVEVLHGANAIHGLGASGGIINFITRKPSDTLEQSVRLETGFQTQNVADSADYGATYTISNSIGNADVLASMTYRNSGYAYDANGDLIGADNTQGDTMDSEAINGFLKTGYNWDDQRVELMANRYDIEGNNELVSVPGDVETGVPTGAEKGDLPGEGSRNRVTTLSLNYTNDSFLEHALRVQLFRQDFEGTYGAELQPLATFQDPAYGPNLLDQSQNNSEKIGMKLTMAKDAIGGLPINLVYGVDLLEDKTWQALIQTNRIWVPETSYENTAPFLQLEYTGIENLVVTTGIRHEKSKLVVDDFTTLASAGSRFVSGGEPEFSETLTNFGATYQLTEIWRLFGNYAEAFSMPDVGRVLRGINVPNQSVETFLDLTPILTENTEFGIEFDNGTVNAQLSYYTSESDFGQRLQRGPDGIYTVMREKTEVDGLELRTGWAVTDIDLLGLRYARTEGRYDSDEDDKVDSDLDGANISPDRINVSWDRSWTAHVSSRLQVNYLFDREFEDSNDEVVNEFDGYTTVDLSTLITLPGDSTLSLSVQNLTNKEYFTYYSQTNPNDLRNFTGLGRSFTIAWENRF